MQPIKVAMLGIGHAHADGVMTELRSMTDIFNVVGYVESDEAVLKKKRDSKIYQGLDLLDESEVLGGEKGIEALVIESSMDKLVCTAQKFRGMKLPMHMDKPTAGTNPDDFLNFIDYMEKENVPIQMGYMYRYNAAIQESMKKIKNGELGIIYEVDGVMDTELTVAARKNMEKQVGGAMYVYGCHMLDLVMRCMGKPKCVHPFLKQTKFELTDSGSNCYDSCFVVLEYEKGVSTVRATAVEANGYGRRQLVICGSKGTIEIKPMERPMKMTFSKRDGKDIYTDKAKVVDLSAYGKQTRYHNMMLDFARKVRGITEIGGDMICPVDYEYEKNLHKLILQASGR
jgi:predicted dehydrogenase